MLLDTFRLILVTAAAREWKIRQLDVITSFLAGKLTELVYLRVSSELRYVFGDCLEVINRFIVLNKQLDSSSYFCSLFLMKSSLNHFL